MYEYLIKFVFHLAQNPKYMKVHTDHNEYSRAQKNLQFAYNVKQRRSYFHTQKKRSKRHNAMARAVCVAHAEDNVS